LKAHISNSDAQSIGEAQPRDGYLPLRTLARYAGLSVRTLRSYLVDRAHPLPHYRIGGRVLVKQSDFDRWTAQFRRARQDPSPVDQIVNDLREEGES